MGSRLCRFCIANRSPRTRLLVICDTTFLPHILAPHYMMHTLLVTPPSRVAYPAHLRGLSLGFRASRFFFIHNMGSPVMRLLKPARSIAPRQHRARNQPPAVERPTYSLSQNVSGAISDRVRIGFVSVGSIWVRRGIGFALLTSHPGHGPNARCEDSHSCHL